MRRNSTQLLIVGAGVAGQQISAQLKKLPQEYQVKGFIDDDHSKLNTKVNNIPVLGRIENLGSLAKKYKVDEVLIAIPSSDGKTVQRILDAAGNLRLRFKIIPRTLEIIQGDVQLYQLRELDITDLLGKALIKSEQTILRKEFKDKKILVTGAAGSIGSELCRQLIQFSPAKLVAFDWSENGLFELNMEILEEYQKAFISSLGNVQDIKRLTEIFKSLQPDFVFHAAAFKHVPLTQNNPLEAIKNNIFGTINMVKAAVKYDTDKFIYISSDKAADPVSIMGATKLIGEKIVREANGKGNTKFATVRFGNVLESSGSVIPIFRRQIADGGPVTVTDPKMTRFFMSIPEAVQLVLQSAVLERGEEIFVLEMGEQVKIDNLARYMIQLAGFIPDLDIKIRYIGSRPGEKLEESLAGKNEHLIKIQGSRIFKVNSVEKFDMSVLETLEKAVVSNNTKNAVSILKVFSPGLMEV